MTLIYFFTMIGVILAIWVVAGVVYWLFKLFFRDSTAAIGTVLLIGTIVLAGFITNLIV